MKHLCLTSLILLTILNSKSVNAQFTACGSGLEHGAYALLEFNNELHVCGAIDSAGGIAVNQLAKRNGSSWTGFGGPIGPNNTPVCMIIYNNKLIVGGSFTTMDGMQANHIAS
jgi:hypothetical protein